MLRANCRLFAVAVRALATKIPGNGAVFWLLVVGRSGKLIGLNTLGQPTYCDSCSLATVDEVFCEGETVVLRCVIDDLLLPAICGHPNPSLVVFDGDESFTLDAV